ncbi:hypothetical protein B0H16DRAFT_1721869 [Mycena metata]|uniref:Uncharacterized protein n=1 Tax=Mycena metata TaxID=1033252 RepID=A0AAD7J7N9_9AGAR|nr:hypothetical protein B0H16DRAFT_1721869 [Mycena metata]
MSPSFDSRKFSTSRLRSAHGYDDEPVIDDGLTFRLPRFDDYHSRIIERRGAKWMIWSPNSRQDPFYPGAYVHQQPLPLPSEKEQLRTDGHGGRWDYTHSPQHYSSTRPWLGFIVRPGFQEPFDVEYDEVYSVWESTSPEGGRIPPDVCQALAERNDLLEEQIRSLLADAARIGGNVVSQRPRYPDSPTLFGLTNIDRYEKLLDRLTECQRGIKEKAAWVTFVRTWVLNPPSVEFELRDGVIRAEEKYIGTWLNGEHPEFGWWFLTRAAIPCFIINRLGNRIPATAQLTTFTERTPVVGLQSPYYEYDRIALANGGRFTTAEVGYLRATRTERNGLDLARSDLRWQLKMPHLCALPYTRGLAVREPTPLSVESPLPDSTTLPAEASTDVEMPRAVPLEELSRLPGTGRDESNLPPPIAPAANSKGSWVIFAETDPQEKDPGYTDDQPVMLERGKNSRGKGDMEDGQEMWYCRERKRKLIFDELPRLKAEFADDPEFGRPVPPWKFWHPGDGKWVKRAPSEWMYRREKPDPRRVGETFRPAEVAEAIEREVEMQVETELRVADREATPALSDDGVSLGSESSKSPSPIHQGIEYGEALRVVTTTPLSESDIVMKEVEMGEVAEEEGGSVEGNEAAATEIPYTDSNDREPTQFVRIMGSSLNFSTQDMVDWIGVGGMQRVRRMWRIVVRGYTVDFVLEAEDRTVATRIVQDASADNRFRNNARFLEREEMYNATRGLEEQLSRLPLSRRVAPAYPPFRPEGRGRPQSNRSYSSSSYSRSPSPKRGIKRSRSRSQERGREQRLRRLSPPRPPFIPRRPPFPSSSLPFAVRPRTPPNAPRAMLPTARLGQPTLPPPPPPVPYATRPRIPAVGARSTSEAPALLRRMTATPLPVAPSLLDRLRPAPALERKSLMKRVEVTLEERISVDIEFKPRHRPHRRTHKRINKLVDEEMEIARPVLETYPWTDAEIDFFIDQEEGPPPPDEMYEPFGDFYDTDEE